MSIVRKNNLGKALIRLLIGLVVLALVVLLVVKLLTNNTATTIPDTADITPTATAAVLPDETAGIASDVTVQATEEPVATPTPTPEPTATPTPTPTPVPTATPVPASMYAGVSTKAATYPWKFTEGRILNGVSSLDILNSENGGNVISLIGWGYANHEEFNGRDCEIWLVIRDTAGNTKCFTVTRSTGLTGVEHSGAKNSRNLSMCDFSCVIDVSKFPDGEYQMGTAVRYVIGKNTRSFAYTFGDDYNFTVSNGIVTSIGGIENN